MKNSSCLKNWVIKQFGWIEVIVRNKAKVIDSLGPNHESLPWFWKKKQDHRGQTLETVLIRENMCPKLKGKIINFTAWGFLAFLPKWNIHKWSFIVFILILNKPSFSIWRPSNLPYKVREEFTLTSISFYWPIYLKQIYLLLILPSALYTVNR